MRRTQYIGITLTVVLMLAAVGQVAASQHIQVELEGTEPTPGETMTVTVTMTNGGSNATGAIVDLTSLPEGWSIENRSDAGGIWQSNGTKWLFQQVDAGSSVSPSITVAVPDDASGEYTIEALASTGDMNATASMTVSVGTQTTAQTTSVGTTAADGNGGGDGESSGFGPGFGVGAAVAALLAVALLARRRQ